MTDEQKVDTSPANVARVLRDIANEYLHGAEFDAGEVAHFTKADQVANSRAISRAREYLDLAAALEDAAPRNADPSALTNANVLAHLINTNESLTSEQYRAMSAGVDALRAAAPAVREAEPTWAERVENAKEALTEYDRRDHAWDMREAASIVLRAAFPERAPEGR